MSITNNFFEQLNDPKAALWSAGVAFNRSNPLPLDKWSVFESMEAATAYAETNAVAYPGQIVAVYDNNVMAAYILVETENTLSLKAIGTVPVGDEVSIEIVDGKLTLVGFNAAEEGAQLVKGTDGKLSWAKPDTTTVDGINLEITKLQNSVSTLQETVGNTEKGLVADVADLKTSNEGFEEDITNLKTLVGEPAAEDKEASGIFADLNTKANADSVYTKTETDIAIRTNIAQAITDSGHLKRKIVADLAALEAYKNEPDALQYIYMVPTDLVYVAADDKYDEYIIIETSGTDEVGNPTTIRTIEKVGSWEVDLSDYVKTEDLNDYALKSEVETVSNTVTGLSGIVSANKTAIENALAEEVARAQAAEQANATRIEEVSDVADEALETAKTAQKKAEDAQTGVDQININIKDRLLTDDDKIKLEKLVISDDGSVGISGNINASQVKELDTWIANNAANHIVNLTENNLSESLVTKINFITSVNTDEFAVNEGNLNLNIIEGSKVNLNTNDEFAAAKLSLVSHGTEIENLKVSVETNTGKLSTLETITIPNIQAKFNDYVLTSVYNQDMNEIKDILTWKEMS